MSISSEFDLFWASYPRKVGKLAAANAWHRQRPPIQQVMEALLWQMMTPQWQNLQYVPHPRTWLMQGRWMDEQPSIVPDFRIRPAGTQCPRCGSLEGLCADIKVCNRRWLDQQKNAQQEA